MAGIRLGMRRLACLLALSALVFLPGLGNSGRLSYHEAFVAQGAREMLDSGAWGYPTIGGLPWLEKPPMPWWLVAALGRCVGGVDETVARLPSAMAAMLLVLGVAVAATRITGRASARSPAPSRPRPPGPRCADDWPRPMCSWPA